jgi:hypothetical protein
MSCRSAARQPRVVATLILPTAQLPLGIKTHTNNNVTILNNIQLLGLASGSSLQSSSQTYAYAYAKLRHYGVVYGTYGSRWPGNLQPLTTLDITARQPRNRSCRHVLVHICAVYIALQTMMVCNITCRVCG